MALFSFFFANGGLGHLGVFGVIWGQNRKFLNLHKFNIKMKVLIPWLQKIGSRGHPAPNFGVFEVIWGQNSKFFKLGKTIYQNEALGPLITKKLIPKSPDPKLRVFGVT